MAQRVKSHAIETRAKDIIRALIDSDDRGLFREITERDYGIDAIVEVFEDKCVTGKIGLIQCKGKEDVITPLKNFPQFVSCSGITMSNLSYLAQKNTAVILTYASVKDPNNFYYADIKDVITEAKVEELEHNNASSVTVRIPITNNAKDNIDGFFEIIEKYYDS